MEDGVKVARELVAERFPEARAAWLGGSVARGTATATSDLDVTVLLAGAPAPMRESLEYCGWPVEVFVHTEASLAHFRDKDQQRRQPTMMRLVGESVVLLDTDGSGVRLREACLAEVQVGPAALSDTELGLLRYRVTDLLEDLIGAADNDVRTVVASVLWQEAAALLLIGERLWTGTGKGLLREIASYDEAHGTCHANTLPAALRAAVQGDIAPLTAAVDTILAPHGGRLFAGFHLAGPTPISE